MADRMIQDFATLGDAHDDDLLLVSSDEETYNIKVKTLKDAVKGDADRAEAAAVAAKNAANAAKQDAETAISTADDARTKAAAAQQAAEDAADDADKAEIAATNASRAATASASSASAAEASARQAQNSAAQASDDMGTALEQIEEIRNQTQDVSIEAADLGLTQDDDGYVYPTYKGVASDTGIKLVASGGGGGSTGPAISVRAVGGTTLRVMAGEDAVLQFRFLSVEEGEDIGADPGTAELYVGSGASRVLKETKSVPQGVNSWNVTKYLASSGSTSFRVAVTDSAGQKSAVVFTVQVINIRHTDSVDESIPITGDYVYSFIAYGAVAKTLHVEVDGTEIITEALSAATGRRSSVTIPAQEHGSRLVRTWLTASIDGMEVSGPVLTHDLIWLTPGAATPVIVSNFTQDTAVEGETIEIPHIVYDPSNPEPTVEYYVNDMNTPVKTMTPGRTWQTWTVTDYPAGENVFKIKCGITEKVFNVTVSASQSTVRVKTDGALLMLSASGRSNSEEKTTVAKWPSKIGNIVGTLSGFQWGSNGWMGRFLRVNGAARVNIPLKIFGQDFRPYGRTIEIEAVFSDVQDKNAAAITCMNDGKGIEITPHTATLATQSKSTSTVYGDGQRLRIAFAIEKSTDGRNIHTYINGFGYGYEKYSENDNFAQNNPVDLVIGSDYCTVDVYSVNVYDHCLTQQEIEDNYAASRDTNAERDAIVALNNVYNETGEISLQSVLKLYPAMLLVGPELPLFKADTDPEKGGHKMYVDVTFYNPDKPEKNFICKHCEIKIQGTSSEFYRIKNYKIKLPNGYVLMDGVEEKTFCLKANYMDSSGKRNTGSANFINGLYNELTPGQQANELCRTTVQGYSMVLFYAPTEDDTPEFAGLYDFNLDKGSTDSLGFTDPDRHQCWELKDNQAPLCLFQTADFSNWENAFEARYPDGCTDTSALQRLVTWIVSCRGNPAKFKAEAYKHFNLHFLCTYPAIAEVITDMDGLAKNMHIACWNVGDENEIWYPIFYDIDSIIMLDNEGHRKFDPGYEFFDDYGTSGTVFNGSDSLLWQLVMDKDVFFDNVAAEYRRMRGGKLTLENLMAAYHADKLDDCAALYNTDGEYKYFNDPTYAYAYQGPGDALFYWWLSESLACFDSKYDANPFTSKYINMRLYVPKDSVPALTLKRATRGYLAAKFGDYSAKIRAEESGKAYTVYAPEASFSDSTEWKLRDAVTNIFGADWITSLGDLSPCYPAHVDITDAIRLADLIIGSAAQGYTNSNLTSLEIGSKPALLHVNVQNCPNLTGELDLSGCQNIRQVLAGGSGLQSVKLPVGGYIDTLQIDEPTTLIICQHSSLTTLDIKSYAKLSTLWVDDASPNVDWLSIVQNAPSLRNIRLKGINWNLDDASLLLALMQKKGIEDNGLDAEVATLTGTVNITRAGRRQVERIRAAFGKDLTINVTTLLEPFTVTFANTDGTTLNEQQVDYGESAVEPIAAGLISTPKQASDPGTDYTFSGWYGSYENVTSDVTIVAMYTSTARTFKVEWYVGATVQQTDIVYYGESSEWRGDVPSLSLAGKYTLFDKWDKSGENITEDTKIYALFHQSDMYPEYKAFALCNPAELHRMIQTGVYRSTDTTDENQWKTGNDIPLTLLTGENITMRLAAFNYMDKADGTGKAAVSLTMKDVLNQGRAWGSNVNDGGFPASSICAWLENVFFQQHLPWAWRQIIVPVIRRSSIGGGTVNNNDPYKIVQCKCNVYLHSYGEVFGGSSDTPYNYECGDTYVNESGVTVGRGLPIYSGNGARIKKLNNGAGQAKEWWTCSPDPSSGSSARGVAPYGAAGSNYVNSGYGVAASFSIE